MKKIIEDPKKFLFICGINLNENENNTNNSYVVYNLETMDFSFSEIYSNNLDEEYLDSIKRKYEFASKDEIKEIISLFSKMNINAALIIKEYF